MQKRVKLVSLISKTKSDLLAQVKKPFEKFVQNLTFFFSKLSCPIGMRRVVSTHKFRINLLNFTSAKRNAQIWSVLDGINESSKFSWLQRMVTSTFEKRKCSRNASMTHPEFLQQFRRLCPDQVFSLISKTKSDLLAQFKNRFEKFVQISTFFFSKLSCPIGMRRMVSNVFQAQKGARSWSKAFAEFSEKFWELFPDQNYAPDPKMLFNLLAHFVQSILQTSIRQQARTRCRKE